MVFRLDYNIMLHLRLKSYGAAYFRAKYCFMLNYIIILISDQSEDVSMRYGANQKSCVMVRYSENYIANLKLRYSASD
jgi:hypothetical protein